MQLWVLQQDSMDLVAGHYTVNRGTPSPLRQAGIDALSVSTYVPTCIQELLYPSWVVYLPY